MASRSVRLTNGPATIRLLVAMLMVASTSGCVSRMLNERDDAYCQSKGNTPGSKAYFQCRLHKAVD